MIVIILRRGVLKVNPNQQTNGKAVASMVLGICSLIIPIIGLILGIIGIVLSKKATTEIITYNQAGNGMAIAGLTTSIIGVCIYGMYVIFAIIIGGLLSL